MAETEADRVAEHAQITDHADAGARLLPLQFRDKTKIAALLRSWLAQAQEIEDALWDVLVSTTLDTATGDALDQLGALLAHPRATLTDEEYRVILRGIIRARKSSGTSEDLLGILTLLLDPVTYSTLDGWASFLVEPHEPLAVSAEAILAVLKLAKAGGVQLQLVTPPDEETALFAFSSQQFFDDGPDVTQGLSDEDQLDGGQLTGVIE